MKRMASILLCAAMFLGIHASAEAAGGGVWVSGYASQYYYHAAQNCRLARHSGELTRRALSEAGDLSPCPVCCPDETDYTGFDGVETGPLECFERGGTLVIRLSDYAIRARMSGASEPAQVPEALLHENANAADDVARLIHGKAYADWADSALPGTEYATEALIPDVDADRTDALLMSRRHIGAAWVLVVRPGEADRAALKNGGYYHLPMVFYRADLIVRNYDAGPIISQGEGSARWAGDVALLPEASSGEVVFRDDEDWTGLQTYVVRDGGVSVGVFRGDWYGDGYTNCGTLDYLGQVTPLEGYPDEERKRMVYVCALTDGEVKALEERMGLTLYGEAADWRDDLPAAPAADAEPVASVTLPDGTVAAMDQAEYPVGTGFVSYTLTRPEGGIAWYNNAVDLDAIRDGAWTSIDGIAAYADGDPERGHSGYFCDRVTLTVPLKDVGALEPGLYALTFAETDWEVADAESQLEFRVAEDAPAPKEAEKRTFGGEGLIVMPHDAPGADAETYNSCTGGTRVYEGGRRTAVLAGDTVFDLRGVDESWGWGVCSAYSLFAYPEGHPEQARQIMANFDHPETTMFDLGDGLLLYDDGGGVYRCDYDGGNLTELYRVKDDTIYGLVPVAGGVYLIQDSSVWYAALDGFDPKPIYEAERDIRDGDSAIYAGEKLILADETGIFALDVSRPNADGTLPAHYLTDEYDDDSGMNGLGYIALGGRLYYWSEREKAMMSVKLDGADRQMVSRERYWFNSVTSGGCVLALSGTQEGFMGDERTAAALYFPPDPQNPTFDPDHSKKHAIDEDSYCYVLGDWYYHRDADGNETRTPLRELTAE